MKKTIRNTEENLAYTLLRLLGEYGNFGWFMRHFLSLSKSNDACVNKFMGIKRGG